MMINKFNVDSLVYRVFDWDADKLDPDEIIQVEGRDLRMMSDIIRYQRRYIKKIKRELREFKKCAKQ